MQNKIKKVVVVGGGTAGWMAAAALSKSFGNLVQIELVESDEIGIVGVGEATIPQIKLFLQLLGLNEQEFIKETNGSFKLGIEFQNWGEIGDRYMHAFGGIGIGVGMLDFYQYWLKAKLEGAKDSLWDYSLNWQASLKNKFAKLDRVGDTRLQGLAYAYHFDASLFAKFLRGYSENIGVTRTEGKIEQVSQSENGNIKSVTLQNGQEIKGDLFIDCSGFRGLLTEQTLNTGYEDWTHWLPCDKAVAVPCENGGEFTPYTRSTAHSAGWQWRIPLQNRIGNGHVFCSKYMSEDEATSILLNNLDGDPLADPRAIPFKTGMRKLAWNKNVVTLGLASGFMEPLESTSIHLVQYGIGKLIELFPLANFNDADRDEYNRQLRFEYEKIRDFIILHYHLNQRTDSQFWIDCRGMEIPKSLQQKMDLFKASGRIFREGNELFTEVGWLQVLIGQNLLPEACHPLAEHLTKVQIRDLKSSISTIIAKAVSELPTQEEFIKQFTR